MMRNGFWPHALGTQLSRPSWPVVLLVMAGLHLWLLVWARSLNPSPGTAAPLQSPQVRWLQAAVLPAPEPKPQAAPKADATRSPPPRLQAPPQHRRPPPPTTAPTARAPQRTPDPVPLPVPLPRNDAPTPEAPTAPATPPAAPATRAADDAPPPPHRAATSHGNAGPSQVSLTPMGGGLGAARPWGPSDPAPSAAPVRPVDAHQFGCDFPRPPYPRLARLNGESGTAVIHLSLTAGGQIATAGVERSSGSAALDSAALASARAGQCSPGASARLATVPFHFQLAP